LAPVIAAVVGPVVVLFLLLTQLSIAIPIGLAVIVAVALVIAWAIVRRIDRSATAYRAEQQQQVAELTANYDVVTGTVRDPNGPRP
jgi:ABC-type protease/lipase transport system fused ATPase/permease subunit